MILIMMVAVLITFFTNTTISGQSSMESFGESIHKGIRYFFKHPILLSAVSLDLFAVLFGGAVALLPAFADTILHAGPEGLGYLRSAPAIGAVTMSLIMAFYPPHNGAGKNALVCRGLWIMHDWICAFHFVYTFIRNIASQRYV